MTDRELLQAIYNDTQELKQDVSILKNDTQELKHRVTALESDMQDVKHKVTTLESDMQDVKHKVTTLESDVQDVKHKVTTLESDVQDVKHKVTKIDLTIDNEIRVNIKRVAEGHLDLSRDLKEAIKSNSEVEMLTIKVNMLDTDVGELKHKIS